MRFGFYKNNSLKILQILCGVLILFCTILLLAPTSSTEHKNIGNWFLHHCGSFCFYIWALDIIEKVQIVWFWWDWWRHTWNRNALSIQQT